MRSIQIPDELYARLERTAESLPEFDNTEAFVQYTLESIARELEQSVDAGDGASSEEDRADTTAMKDRLEDLGYL